MAGQNWTGSGKGAGTFSEHHQGVIDPKMPVEADYILQNSVLDDQPVIKEEDRIVGITIDID